ncbi:MAG: glycosyltransferase family 9 protein, partial [Gemmatimonadales bacterium]|nr:glycosyltransferase family 9 protein [Gemmatimonadales bacterium]
LLRALRSRHPEARIVVLTEERYTPLLRENPNVDQVAGVGPDASLWAWGRSLRRHEFSYLLDLQGDVRGRCLRLLVPGRWRGARRPRFAQQVFIHTKRNLLREAPPIAERYFSAAQDLDVEPDGEPVEFFLSEAGEAEATKWLAQSGMGESRPLVAFVPGAAQATRRWPADSWVELIKRVTDTGADAVIVGGRQDATLAADIALRGGARAASSAGLLSLQGIGAILKRAEAAIAGDGGVLHMATGVGTPVVALFGPTVREFGRFPYRAHATVVERDLRCRPCSLEGGRTCPLKHHDCMHSIHPPDVFNVLARILK